MSAPHWTPGPWRAERNSLGVEVFPSGPISECGTEFHVLGPPLIPVNDEADAHLIAAAPDLYESLEYVASLLKDWCADQSTETGWKSDELAEQWVKAQAALAKARGERA